jgi:hypothetical protein
MTPQTIPQIRSVEDINMTDEFNPADMVYDVDGIQIYKNKDATIMIKMLKTAPREFIALYSESPKTPDEMIQRGFT